MSVHDETYLALVDKVLAEGVYTEDRTGVGTLSSFGHMAKYDLSAGFPILTTKKVFWRGVVAELLFFLRGEENIAYLHEHDVHIWDEWADENGNLGPIYGTSWRDFGGPTNDWFVDRAKGVDQLNVLLRELRRHPSSRRHIMTSWNPRSYNHAALPPCHGLTIQFNVAEGRLNCAMYQRSADLFLGVPFNIASYALLTHILAKEVGLEPGVFTHMIGDTHIYLNHLDAFDEQFTRPTNRPAPTLHIADRERDGYSPMNPLPAYEPSDFVLEGYDPFPTIKAEVAV